MQSSNAYRKYLLILLMAILTFNFVDRLALGLVLQDIKRDLKLSDTQLGLLSGIAFALFYSLMGLPLARWADRGNRVAIIAATTAAWSVLVALCGMATNFLQMMLIRVGVGVGEAGCMPPAQSLIADYFDRAERPRATAVYMQGLNLSPIVAYFAAGWLNQFYGWRAMFAVVSLPGLALGLLAWLTIREPRHASRSKVVTADETNEGLRSQAGARLINGATLEDVYRTLWTNTTFRHLLYSFVVFYFFAYGVMQWQPAFFVRSFGLTTGEIGTWFAIVLGVGGLLGTYVGGVWASRCARNNESLQLKAMAVANAVFNALAWSLTYVSGHSAVAFAWMGLSTLGGVTILGPMYSMIQTLVPAGMRAVAVAVVLLLANLVGMGLGPLAVGALSDALHPLWGTESLRYTLLAFSPGFLWASWHLWQASNTVGVELRTVVDDHEQPGELRDESPQHLNLGH